MWIILLFYLLQDIFIDGYRIALMQIIQPFLLQFGLIVANDGASNVGSFFRLRKNTTAEYSIVRPVRVGAFRTFSPESQVVGDRVVAFGCNYTLDFNVATKASAECFYYVVGSSG